MNPRTGTDLLSDIKNLSLERVPIVHDFLFKGDCMMLASSAGVGKSTVVLQICLSISTGIPMFGAIEAKKSRVYYLQTEGDYEETIERIRCMIPQFPDFDGSDLVIDKYKYLDLSIPGMDKFLIERIRVFLPDVVIIDPIYKLTSKDICTGEGALQVIKMSDMIKEELGATLVLVHHNTKQEFEIVDGKKEAKSDSYYGHSFIKNHIRTGYALRQSKDGCHPSLLRTKGRGSDTLQRIDLEYNPETMICHMMVSEGNPINRIQTYARILKAKQETTSFKEVSKVSQVTDRYLRKLKAQGQLGQIFDFYKDPNDSRREIWKPV